MKRAEEPRAEVLEGRGDRRTSKVPGGPADQARSDRSLVRAEKNGTRAGSRAREVSAERGDRRPKEKHQDRTGDRHHRLHDQPHEEGGFVKKLRYGVGRKQAL